MLDELQQKYPMRGKVPKSGITHTRGIKIEHAIMCFWNTSKEFSRSGFCAVECCWHIQQPKKVV